MIYGDPHVPLIGHIKNGLLLLLMITLACWVYLLTDKTEVRSVFMNFHSMIYTQFHTKIQILRTDNGTEYLKVTLGGLKGLIGPLFLERVQFGWIDRFLKRRFE